MTGLILLVSHHLEASVAVTDEVDELSQIALECLKDSVPLRVPLPQGTLRYNLGLPMTLLCTGTAASALARELDAYVQAQLRWIALQCK